MLDNRFPQCLCCMPRGNMYCLTIPMKAFIAHKLELQHLPDFKEILKNIYSMLDAWREN